MKVTDTALNEAIRIAKDDSHGYDQINRWGPDYDCSSLVIQCWENAGVPVKENGASYTGNMYSAFLKSGFVDVSSIVNVKNGDGLLAGDVLLNVAHHTAMYCGNGYEVEASINENGTVKSGKTGDQTGREIFVRKYRNYPWDYVLRYKENTKLKTYEDIANEVIAGKWGNGEVRRRRLEKAGYNYLVVQKCVNTLLR